MVRQAIFVVAIVFISLGLLADSTQAPADATIWFNIEPGSFYAFDSFDGQPASGQQQQQQRMTIDCSADKTYGPRRNENISIQWFKDGIYLETRQHANLKGDNLYQEILANGSLLLQLTPGSGGGYNRTDSMLEPLTTVQCVADDSFGKVLSRPVKLFRLRKDWLLADQLANKFIRQPDNTTLVAGKRLILKCKPNITQLLQQDASAQHAVNYQWFKNSKLLPLNSRTILYRDGTLEISQTTEPDSGVYKCLVKYRNFLFESRQAFVQVINKLTTTTTPIIISTANVIETTTATRMSTPSFYLWPEDKSAQEGDEAVLECLASNDLSFGYSSSAHLAASKEFSYKWLKDGVALNFSTFARLRLQLIQGNNLRIQGVQESDSGTYTCQICHVNSNPNSNSNRPTDGSECDERSGVLRVLVPPRFVTRPKSLNATLKSDVEFECRTYGVPAPKIQWFKNGEPIYPSEYFQFNPVQGDLKILGIIAQDEGYYQCLASNELNTIQSIAQLVVLKSGAIYDYEDYGDASSQQQQEDDYGRGGEYEFGKGHKSVKLKKATLSPSPAPSKNLLLLKQKSQAVPTSTVSSVTIELSAPVNLRLIKTKSRSIHIEWHPPPIIRSNDPKLQRSTDSLVYSVNWKAKNMERQRELNTTKTNVVIDELAPDTTYQINVLAIMATTKSPDASIEIKTDVEAKVPGVPVDFKASFGDPFSSASSLRFKWHKPAVNAQGILKYRLYYKHMSYGPYTPTSASSSGELDSSMSSTEQGDYLDSGSFDPSMGDPLDPADPGAPTKLTEKFIDIESSSDGGVQTAEVNEWIVEDLLKYSTYRFRLVAFDRELLGQVTNETSSANLNYAELFIETPSDVPDGPPESVQLEILNTTAISVAWQPPLIEKCNGLIIGYQLTVKGHKYLNLTADREPTFAIISDLMPGQKYSIRVTAKTVNGSGPWSDWVFGETFARDLDESRVPGQPLELHAEPTGKSIVIHWVPPVDSSKVLVRKYLLKYGIGFPDNEVLLPGNLNSYIINSLIPSSQYVLSLRALNNAGNGMEILKDVFTKRKSVLDDNDILFPPLNVQAVAISTQSIELRWTDWHLKPEENIPDERLYTVRYCVADQTNPKYKFRNATERNMIITDLKANTLYDFWVRLVIGQRASGWSMTASQMTMESSPAPRNVNVKSDPNIPSAVTVSWQAPNYATPNTGYTVFYTTEKNAEKSTKQGWKQEIVTNQQLIGKPSLSVAIKQLKLNTTYYFKVQARNSRTYGASSPTVLFRTPALRGELGKMIKVEDESSQESSAETTATTVVTAVQVGGAGDSNSTELMSSVLTKGRFELNLMWILIGSAVSLVVLLLFCVAICIGKRSSRGKPKPTELKINQHKRGSSSSRSYDNCNSNSSKPTPNGHHVPRTNIDMENDEDSDSAYHQQTKAHNQQQQQKLLTCNTNFQQEWTNQNGPTTTSLLISQQQQLTAASRTPSHHASHHLGQPLLINNPNHMMMTLMSSNSGSNHHQHQYHHGGMHGNDGAEFYSSASAAAANNQPLLTNSSHSENMGTFTDVYMHQQHQHQHDDRFSHQSGGGGANELTSDITNTSAALAAANAAFNAPFANSNLIQTVNGGGGGVSMNNDQSAMFMRHTIRPKPIAIPLNTTTSTTMSTSPSPLANSSLNANEHHNMFTTSAAHRKSFKNLPIATATLIPSVTNPASTNHHNGFGDSVIKQHSANMTNANNGYFSQPQSNVQKLHYTARPYIIDNQVQSNYSGNNSNGDYSNHHSPASSHSSSQPPVYDKIGNVINANGTSMAPSSVSTKSLLQPLKSFGSTQSNPQAVHNPAALGSSSVSIPNTPAKYCDNFVNMSRSPAKKIVTNANNRGKSSEMLHGGNMMMGGKSVENIYDKKQGGNNEELTVEMANLEGIMKDLNAITAQQFEC